MSIRHLPHTPAAVVSISAVTRMPSWTDSSRTRLVDRRARADGDESLAPLFGGVDDEFVFTHLARAPGQVADVDRERQFLVFTHTPDSIVAERAHLRAR